MMQFLSNIFGIKNIEELSDKNDEVVQGQVSTDYNDGAYVIENVQGQASVMSNMASFDLNFSSQADLIEMYRLTAQVPEVKSAIEDVVGEAISYAENEHAITISLSDVEDDILAEKTRQKIEKIWEDKIINLIDLDNEAHSLFQGFYIDGIKAAHILPSKKKNGGLDKVVVFDAVDIVKFREEKRDANTGLLTEIKEFYKYTPNSALFKRDKSMSQDTPNYLGVAPNKTSQNTYILDPEVVAYTTSGMRDSESGLVKSWLHEAVKVANQLTTLENALVIYRITRAPERRAFYIDVGGLQSSKATQYVENLKSNFRNRMTFDPTSGSFKDKRHLMTMQEDFWLPRQNGRSTEIQTLQGGANLGEIDDILYFLKKLYKALNLPASRIDDSSSISFDRTPELSRDELKFTKYVSRIRGRFNIWLSEILRAELILSNTITNEEWELIKNKIQYNYSQDFYLEERKRIELLRQRIEVSTELGVTNFVGNIFSMEYIKKDILKLTESEIEILDKAMEKEKKDGLYDDLMDDDTTIVKHTSSAFANQNEPDDKPINKTDKDTN